jgi:hypothetical protein
MMVAVKQEVPDALGIASIMIATSAVSSIDSVNAQVTTASVTTAKLKPVVPETNTGFVLLPFFALFLLWSSLTLLRPRGRQEAIKLREAR